MYHYLYHYQVLHLSKPKDCKDKSNRIKEHTLADNFGIDDTEEELLIRGELLSGNSDFMFCFTSGLVSSR